MRDRVFEERYRLERDGDADGYGIGLSLCRRIITAHYGHIWVDDAIGKKAVVSDLRFPFINQKEGVKHPLF